MNYAMFGDWVQCRIEELVDFGVPRKEAERIIHVAEIDAVQAAIKVRSEEQFLLDFRALGTTVLAERHGVTRQAIRKRWQKIQNGKAPVVTQVCGVG